MTSLRFSFLSVLAIALMLVSCNSDDIDTGGTVIIDPPPTSVNSNPLLERSNTSTTGLELGCITILYPFELVDIDNNTYSVASEQDLTNLTNDSTIFLVDFVYPFDAVINDVAETIDDTEELASVFAQCIPDTGFSTDGFPAYNISDENSCYELVFPLSVLETDGSSTTINDEAAFDVAVADRLLFFEFPLQLEDENGNIVSAADPDELFNYLISCSGWDTDSTVNIGGVELIACYTLEFPFSVVLADGSTVTVNNHQELCDLMLRGQIADYAYPLTLSLNDSTFTIVDQQALDLAVADCPGYTIDIDDAFFLFAGTQSNFDTIGCWTVNYPIDVVSIDGVTSTISDQPSFEMAVFDGTAISLIYPVSYTFNSSGTTSTATNTEELLNDLATCQ